MRPNFKYPYLIKSLLGLVMLVYVVGTFHNGILEIAHMVSHQVSSENSFHTHSSSSHDHGHSHDHEHTTITITKKVFENFNYFPTEDSIMLKYSLDKKPQICHSASIQLTGFKSFRNDYRLLNSELPNTPYLSVFSPPPESIV